MKTNKRIRKEGMWNSTTQSLACGLLLAASAGVAYPQWVAYNDHNRGPGTAPNVSTYSPAAAGATVGGLLTNFVTGTLTSPKQVGVTITHGGGFNGATGGSTAPKAGTPAAQVFGGKVDWTASALYFGATTPQSSYISFTFTNLIPGRQYRFKGTAVRGDAYFTTRWTLATLSGVISAKPAHQTGAGSLGIITNGWPIYGDTLAPNTQAAWNSGNNLAGDVIGWDDIVPNGTSFTVINSNWTVATPGGAGNGTYCYAMSAIMLEETADPPVIVSQPQSAGLCVGGSYAIQVGVAGSGPLAFQWRKDGTNIPPATNPTATNQNLFLPSFSASDAGGYSVVLTNSFGSVTSEVATLTLGDTPVSIATQPQSSTNVYGTPATLTVSIGATSAKPVSFQWFKMNPNGTWSVIAGATQPTLLVPFLRETNVANYYVRAANCINTVTSRVASLSLQYLPPVIITQPQDVIVNQGGSATLTVTATGSRPTYQWFKGNTAILNATNASLTLSNLQLSDSGLYHVEVRTPYCCPEGLAVSRNATVIVMQPSFSLIGLTNHVWKYDQSGRDLGTAWKEVNYDDSSWPSGFGAFAKDDSPIIVSLIHTPLSLTDTSGWTNITYYFRTQFTFTNDASLVSLVASNLIDDGCVVYLNGTEIYRINMPAGTVTYNTLASSANPEGIFITTNLPMSLVHPGTNTLAVEVHQASLTSADVVFGLAAQVNFQVPSLIQITRQPQDVVVRELQPATLRVGYIGDAAKLQWYKWNTNTGAATAVPGGFWPDLTLTNTLAGFDDGAYFAVVSNVLGVVTSSTAGVTVIVDTNAPVLIDADGADNPRTVTLRFNEPVLLATADGPFAGLTNVANYTITNTLGESLTISKAVLTNGTNVILTTTTSRRTDANYIATVQNVRDLSPHTNLAQNIACPVSTLVELKNWGEFWKWTQPYDEVPFFRPWADFVSSAWLQPNYDPSDLNLWSYDPGIFFSGSYLVPQLEEFPIPTGDGIGGTRLQTDPVSGITNNQFPAAYFLSTFRFNASPAGATISLRHLIDDGAVLYVNGAEIARINMPAGIIRTNTRALTDVREPTLGGPILIPLTSVRQGTNRIAAELHCGAVPELDLAFGLEMQARIDSLATGKVIITTSPSNVTVSAGSPASFAFRGVGGATFQWTSNSVPILGATNPVFTIPFCTTNANGALYAVRVFNSTSSATSANALLTVWPDTNAPVLVSAYLTSPNTITVNFSERMGSTASVAANYQVMNATGAVFTVTNAVLGTNGTSVVLSLASLPVGTYSVVASNVRDLAGDNLIDAGISVTVGLRDYVLVADGVTQWRYNQENEDLGTAWRGLNYNDTAVGWSGGLALFDGKRDSTNADGSGAWTMRPTVGGENILTRLSFTNAGGSGTIPTYYFRTKFTVPVLGPGATMTIRHLVDDGAAFYLNSNLLYSIRVTVPTRFDVKADPPIGDAASEGPFNVPVTGLVVGTNILAVELKNASATSSDVTFGAYLTLNVPSSQVEARPPAISVQPADILVPPGGPATFQVTATGSSPLSYQWRRNGIEIPWATYRTLGFAHAQTNDLGYYSVVISNPAGSVTSRLARLGFLYQYTNQLVAGDNLIACQVWRGSNTLQEVMPDVPPGSQLFKWEIFGQRWQSAAYLSQPTGWVPGNLTLKPGEGAYLRTPKAFPLVFAGEVRVGSTIRIQPRQSYLTSCQQPKRAGYEDIANNGTDFTGEPLPPDEGTAFVRWLPASQSYDWYFYMWGSWDRYPQADVGEAVWVIPPASQYGLPPIPPLTIVAQPTSRTASPGETVVFSVGATGDQPLQFQWLKDGVALSSQTNAMLTLSNVQPSDAGAYTVILTNLYGSLTSAPALLQMRTVFVFGNGQPILTNRAAFLGRVTIELSSTHSNGNLFFTLDGSAPDSSDHTYARPLTLTHSATLRVASYSTDFHERRESEVIDITILPASTLLATTDGGGTITVDPSAEYYPTGSIVTVSAQPAVGWHFLGWNGDTNGTNQTLFVAMSHSKHLRAVFGTTLSTTASGGGALIVQPSASLYPCGTVLRITAVPDLGRCFSSWGTAASGNTNPLSFVITNPTPTLSAVFNLLPFGEGALTVLPVGRGRVNVDPPGLHFPRDQIVTLTAVADPGQSFLGWSGHATGIQNPLPVALDSSKVITALFTARPRIDAASVLGPLRETGFHFTLSSDVGSTNQVDVSSDLKNWTPLLTITNWFGTLRLIDETATNAPHRFYRAIPAP